MDQSQNQEIAKKTKIVTIVRLRPILANEEDRQGVYCQNENTLQIEINGLKRIEKVQLALSSKTTQRQVFQIVQPLLEKVMEGFNVSILTYGQTGSGKTYTMFGSDWNNIIKLSGKSFQNNKNIQQTTFLRSIQQDQNYAGIIPRSIHLLFDRLTSKRRKYIKIYCSFLQIYNQCMADLLAEDFKTNKETKLIIHENKNDGIYVEGLNEIIVQDPEQCLQLMRRGQKNRIVRKNYMNSKSSRSHTIFTLLIQEVFPTKKTYRRMKINLCDLAGSQKIQKNETMTVDHFEELKNINLSLTTLGKVIGSLATGKSIPPYRQSKLTRLLQDSLGGNTNTAIIATVSSKISCIQQTLSTLKFLERARQVKSEVIAKTYSQNPEMRNLERQISYLRDMLKMRGGHFPNDMQLKQKLKILQQQNAKLKQMVDQELLQKLKKQNIHLKQEIMIQKNDMLSDSFLKSHRNYKTIQENEKNIEKVGSEIAIHSILSQGNTKKFAKYSKNVDTKSLAERTDDSSSFQGSTFQRGTGGSIFPTLHKSGSKKTTSKILDRILQIQKVKQQNKIKLQRQLLLLQKKGSQKLQRRSFSRSKDNY